MKIAPIDIAHKSFSRKMMGFDPEEVMDFLRMISDEMESLIKERNQLKDQLRDKEMSINEYRERDELLKHTITTATKMSEKIRKDTERESKIIISDANHQAEVIVCDAKESLKKIYAEVSDLKRIRMQFENNLKALINSHMTMLDQGHTVMPSPQIDNLSILDENARTNIPQQMADEVLSQSRGGQQTSNNSFNADDAFKKEITDAVQRAHGNVTL
ncbi:MAG: DivIVA domain-containing protein [Bdellovibrionaceae bacterium]|jgi:cell division initiation protein|nr:DivIVA domain-containing protein [Pseudobdellovibrionaceae bacterium]